jgi:hypothetical protein
MAFNKSGETKITTVLMWIAIALVVAYVANFNGFQGTVNGWFGGSDKVNPQQTLVTDTCPTDGITTYTLNVQDALASTATNVNAEYYVFNGNKLIKEGTTGTDGTVNIDVACGKDYKLLLLNTTNALGYYSATVDLSPRIAQDTINAELTAYGTAKILGIENPADPQRAGNTTLGAGAVKNFDLKFVANQTEKGYNQPILLCQVNVSAIQSVSIGSFSDGTPVTSVAVLPKRVTAAAGYVYYAWEYNKMLTPVMGVITASGSITALSSATPLGTDAMTCKLVDQATWKSSSYKTAASIAEGFKTGPENTENLQDVGAYDSNSVNFQFANNGGY